MTATLTAVPVNGEVVAWIAWRPQVCCRTRTHVRRRCGRPRRGDARTTTLVSLNELLDQEKELIEIDSRGEPAVPTVPAVPMVAGLK